AMFEADELPPDLVAISAVRWRAEEAEHHVRTQEFEKFSLLDGAHQLHLLLGRERRDTGRVGKDAGARALNGEHAFAISVALIGVEGGERAIDEEDDAGLARAGRVV